MRATRQGTTPDGRYWLSKRAGSNLWQRTWFEDRQTRRSSLGTDAEEEAHARLLEWWLANRRLVKAEPQSVALIEVLHRYYEDYAKDIASAEFVEIVFRKVKRICEDIAVAQFGKDAQREFMRKVGGSAGYTRRIMGTIRAALAWAETEELITSHPTIKLPPDGIPRDRILSFDESRVLWFATETLHERRFLALAYCTLARPEAILDVTRDMANLDHDLIALNPPGRVQTKKFRPTVPIVPELRPWIEHAGEGHLIQWRGAPVQSFKSAWRSIRKRAGLGSDVFAKTIRSTMATQMRKEGVPEADIKGFLGHNAYQGRTEVYAKYRPEYLQQAAGVVNDYMVMLRNCYATRRRGRSTPLSKVVGGNRK